MDQPPFVSHVGQQAASFLQASYLIDGKVLSFQVPIKAVDDESIKAAIAKLATEVASCPR